jgi:hypothetical protein
MKIFTWGLVIALILALLGFGFWGFVEAQEIKKQGQEIQQITSDTLNLETIRQGQAEVSIEPWKNLSEKSSVTLIELEENMSSAPEELKKDAAQYYGAKSEDKYVEVQYLLALIDAQERLDLKSQQPKSKSQIDSILKEFDNIQNSLNQSNLSLGPEFESTLNKVEEEGTLFRDNLTEESNRMNNESPPVQIRPAGLDKAIDDLKQEIIKSLNEWVDLQNKIKEEISNLSSANWVMPF